MQLPDKPGETIFGVNGDAIRVSFAGQRGRIFPPHNIGDLGGCESHYIVCVVPPEISVEIVKIPPGCTDYDHVFFHYASF
jgi:hypothetical protein